jgi:hypothetical protein
LKHDPGKTLKRGEEEIGLRVVYSRPHHVKFEEDDRGKITAWNKDFVFVRFDGDSVSKACQRSDLWPEAG